MPRPWKTSRKITFGEAMPLYEIRGKIDSVTSIRQITKAMEMVAASKMRKAEERMAASRHYAQGMRKIIAHLAQSKPEYRHPYMRERPVKKVGYIIVSSDRGLCGGFNTNAFRKVVRHMAEWHEKDVPIDLCAIGNKGEQFFKKTPCKLIAEKTHLGDEPQVEQLIGAIRVMLDNFEEGSIDRLFILYNRFVNMMVQQPVIEQLLPLTAEPDERLGHHWDYIYELPSKEVVETVLERYVESLVYQAVVENLACEQAARMVAMQSASSNAEELIEDLQLDYNKGRQAKITQELAEIVGGSRAL